MTPSQITGVFEPVLTERLLETLRGRAAGYDRDNRFCHEDFNDVRAAGYLKLAVPCEFGGFGLTLAAVARETRRLAGYAPATALALNMHHNWVGNAADHWRRGDGSLAWILREAMAGQVFAAGHAESGNDLPGLLSTTTAERVDGGYRFTGCMSFGGLSPVWTRLGVHGTDLSNPATPKVVHGFVPRDAEGVTIRHTWGVLGMRATGGDDTVLEGAFVPDEYIARVVPAGAAGLDSFVLGFLAWELTGLASVYHGVALRAREIIVEQVRSKRSIGVTRSMAYHPEIQHGIAEISLELESIGPHVDTIADEWGRGAAQADWFLKLVAMKYHAVEGAFRVVDRALDLSGGSGLFKTSELERLFRDCRAGRFHPANAALTHEIVGKLTLGIDPDDRPRWG